MNIEKRKQLISEINHCIDNDWVKIEEVFGFDNDIKIAVEEYKTFENSGYTMTFQSIRIGNYSIKCYHDNGEKLVERAELLRASIDKIGIEKTIETMTHEQDWADKEIREWN